MALSITPELREQPGIRIAGADDAAAVCATLAAAFADGPVAEWILPDAAARVAVYRDYSHLLYDHAAAHGLIHITTDHSGAAVWYPRPVEHGYPSPGRLGLLERAIAAHQPIGEYQQLAYLGVRPDRQNQGIGGRLLGYHHRQLDRLDQAAYLVATSRRSRDLYGRHGYRVLERFAPEGGPDLWSMWREPTPGTGGIGACPVDLLAGCGGPRRRPAALSARLDTTPVSRRTSAWPDRRLDSASHHQDPQDRP